jgi:hypothetical protein
MPTLTSSTCTKKFPFAFRNKKADELCPLTAENATIANSFLSVLCLTFFSIDMPCFDFCFALAIPYDLVAILSYLVCWQLRYFCRVLRLLSRILRSVSTFRVAYAIRKGTTAQTCLGNKVTNTYSFEDSEKQPWNLTLAAVDTTAMALAMAALGEDAN